MRWVYLAIVVVFVAALVIFALQNAGGVTVSFLGWTLGTPISLLALVAYILGAATGGSLYGLLRRSVQGYRGGA